MIFDTANPTGRDRDLATDTQGSVLIISEDNDSSDPDDEAHGGEIQFRFDYPAYIKDITVVDAEHGGVIYAFDADGAWIGDFTIPTGANGAVRTFALDFDDVSELVVELETSGAVDDLRYLPGSPDPVELPEPIVIEGTYFMDANDNAVHDAGDVPVAGAVVYLQPQGTITTDEAVATTLTDENGHYRFDDVPEGDYFVRFQNPEDVAAQLGNGSTGVFTVVANQTLTDIDASIVDPGTASLSGRLFMDNNNNDIDDDGDMGVAGQTVQLLDFSDGGEVIAETVTDGDGNYTFEGLNAGEYRVRFLDEGFGNKVFVARDVGDDDTIDSDVTTIGDAGNGSTNTIILDVGEDRTDVDAGIECPSDAVISGRLFMDNNANAVEDAGDTGVAGQTVELVEAMSAEAAVVATAETDADGYYQFDGLPAGVYRVRFLGEDLGGRTFVEGRVGDDRTIDSDVTFLDGNANGSSENIYLGVSEVVTDIDAGIEDPGNAAVAGRVFVDENGNDVDDAEQGAGGVTVQLMTAAGVLVAETVTAEDGSYAFEGLLAGDYQVAFPTDVSNMVLIAANAGDDDALSLIHI